MAGCKLGATDKFCPNTFQKIFGPKEDEPLDYESSYQAFDEIKTRINAEAGENLTTEEVAMGFLRSRRRCQIMGSRE